MKPPTFRLANCYQSLDEAEAHLQQSLPRQILRCCGDEDDGFHCTLFKGHSGDHEAWGVGRVKMEYSWPNINKVEQH